jgi:hypothetical protein
MHNEALVLTVQIVVFGARGEPHWLSLVDDLSDLANQAQDDQAIAWANVCIGWRHYHREDFAAAAIAFRDVCAILEAIHDYRTLSHLLATLARCEVMVGETEQAFAHLARSKEILATRQVGLSFESRSLAPAAEVYLFAAEHAMDSVSRKDMLRLAKQACSRLAWIGRRVNDESAPEALRLGGTYCWMIGDKKRAIRCWMRGLQAAERLQAKRSLAKIHKELGLRTSNALHLSKAEQLRIAAGATTFSSE